MCSQGCSHIRVAAFRLLCACMLAMMSMHCLLADFAEASSSSHNMQDDTTAFQGCDASSASSSANNTQNEPLGILGQFPMSLMNSMLTVPDSTSMDTDLDPYGSGYDRLLRVHPVNVVLVPTNWLSEEMHY